MLEIDETTLKAITSTIDETIKAVDEKKDIRIVSNSLGNVGNKIRALAEIRETPDNLLFSLTFHFLSGFLMNTFGDQEEEWYELNKELCDDSLSKIRILLSGMKSSLEAKSFEKAIDVFKASFFALWPIIRRTTS